MAMHGYRIRRLNKIEEELEDRKRYGQSPLRRAGVYDLYYRNQEWPSRTVSYQSIYRDCMQLMEEGRIEGEKVDGCWEFWKE